MKICCELSPEQSDELVVSTANAPPLLAETIADHDIPSVPNFSHCPNCRATHSPVLPHGEHTITVPSSGPSTGGERGFADAAGNAGGPDNAGPESESFAHSNTTLPL